MTSYNEHNYKGRQARDGDCILYILKCVVYLCTQHYVGYGRIILHSRLEGYTAGACEFLANCAALVWECEQ